MEPKKNPEADLEKKRNLFLQIGLVISLGIVLLAFEWRTYDKTDYSLGQLKVEDVPEEIVPITKQEVPPPPPPPPVPVLNIVENTEEIKNEAKVEETDVTQETKIEVRVIEQKQEEVEEQTIFTIVESMPTFSGCDHISDESKRQECTFTKINEYFSKNINYPPIAKDNGISGTVYLTFVIDPTGNVKDIRVQRGIGGGCDEEAVRAVKSMPRFSPGKQRGKAVSVQYNLPVKFKLR